jgi:Uncharacterized conserved protein
MAFSIHERCLTQMQIHRMPGASHDRPITTNAEAPGYDCFPPPIDYSAWIGRTEEAVDELSRNLIKRIAATFGETAPAAGQPLPPLWMWCFFQEPLAESQLGADGHPARGGFLPPADNRNRMWAGGRVEFIAPLKVGAEAHRLSTILHIEEKHGRTGALLFVTVRHDYSQHGQLCVREEQDIVYREPNRPSSTVPRPTRRPTGARRSRRRQPCCSATPP